MKNRTALMLWALLGSACAMKEEIAGNVQLDLNPPRLLETATGEGSRVTLLFDEPLAPPPEELRLEEGIPARLSLSGENRVVLTPLEELTPGRAYAAPLAIADDRGNSNNFLIRFWAWNPRLPEGLINELNPKGSGNNPDTVELFFLSGGNTAGMALYYGTKRFAAYRYVLPALEVAPGDYLLIHCRPEGIAAERDETLRKDLSGGKLASDQAWDLWLPEDRGLPGGNGVLSLYGSPSGELQDALIYSDRSPDPEDDRLGWTAAVYDAVCDLYAEGAWLFSGDDLSPTEAVRSEYTTGTRTLCRSSRSEDSDGAADWHTSPTSGKTFGAANTDEAHVP